MNSGDRKISVTDGSKRVRTKSLSSGSSDRLKDDERAEIERSKLRMLERKFTPAIEKLTVEEIMKASCYQRFCRSMERIFEAMDDVETHDDEIIEALNEEDIETYDEEVIETLNEEDIETFNEKDIETHDEDIETQDEEYSGEALIPICQLQELCVEAAKVNKLGGMEYIRTNKVTKLLAVLERNICDGAEIYPISDCSFEEDENVSLAMERRMRAIAASLTALYIITSPNIHKQIYLEDVIDRIIVFTKFLLNYTVYPAYDSLNKMQANDIKKERYVEPGRKIQTYCKDVCSKSIIFYYSKLTEVVSLLAELINIQRLTDNSILYASSLGVSSFFVESVSDLQLAALKLVTNIFTKYEKHRKLLLDDILASLARLPSSKRSLRSYRLSNGEHIQMLTALVLHLVQCITILPKSITSQAEAGLIMVSKYNIARITTSYFSYIFLTKCSSKSSEIDYRPIFDNFVQDLLTTVTKPEWPAAELMLCVLGQLLVNNLVKKSVEMSLRLISLDYLGVVAAHLRKDTVLSQLKEVTIDQFIKDIQLELLRDDERISINEINEIPGDDGRTQFLRTVLLDYLAVKGEIEPFIGHARQFYLAHWYQDYCIETSPPTTNNLQRCKKTKRRKELFTSKKLTDENSCTEEEYVKSTDHLTEAYRSNAVKKKFLLSKILLDDSNISKTYVDYSSAEFISKYLASKRPYSQSFDIYLKHILKVLTETSVSIRIKAIKCLISIVEVDPGVLGLNEVQLGVSVSFLDNSTSVRECAVDLVGKFILRRPELISKYYDMLTARILDTGVSVRKRVIKIFKDLCIECPNFEKIPEICNKMIKRINDEDVIRKLVLEVFQNMWFTPVREKPTFDSDALMQKVHNIIDVVAISNDVSIQFMEHLLKNLFKPRDDKDERATKTQAQVRDSILTACRQIVDGLVQTAIRKDGNSASETSQRLVSSLFILYLFAKIKPELVVQHVITIKAYLSLKCQSHGDYQIISCVARTLELVVPLMKHPSQVFLSCLEEDLVKLMMQQDPSCVQACVSCLGSIVNNLTRNFTLIRDCFKRYYAFLTSYKQISKSTVSRSEQVKKLCPSFRRSLFVVGLLLRFFDFTNKEVTGDDLPETIKEDVFSIFIYFLNYEQDSQHYILKAIGFVCIRHYELMVNMEVGVLYRKYLTDENAAILLKVQVLNNIENYLQEEERKIIRQNQEWSKSLKKENLKEMGDIRSGMASTVIQSYLKETLEAFLHPHSSVRNSVLRVVQLVLDQGLVHPVQIVPYLICMSSDEDQAISSVADIQLLNINKKYPGLIHMKAQHGIQLSYKLQVIINSNVYIVRGFRAKEGEPLPSALNGFLYSILRTKQQRRALVLSMLKQFEENAETSLPKMLYLADNMAYFPFKVQDEPLFIIHHIDIILSFTGVNLLESFREALIPLKYADQENNNSPEYEDEETLVRRVPEDTKVLRQCLISFQGCLLLLVLKQHLKKLYGFNDAKLTQYSPNDTTKMFQKSLNKKNISEFNPKVRKDFPSTKLDKEAKRSLISEYLEFKTLLMSLDIVDEDDSYNGLQRNAPSARELIAKKVVMQQSSENRVQDPKLTIVTDNARPNKKRRTQ